MTIVCKFYHDSVGHIKRVGARVYWTPEFMELLVRKFGFFKTFPMWEAEEFFSRWYHLNGNVVRHKILRLLKKEWLKRELRDVYIGRIKRKIYYYSLTEKAKRYYMYWGGFTATDSPIMRRIPA